MDGLRTITAAHTDWFVVASLAFGLFFAIAGSWMYLSIWLGERRRKAEIADESFGLGIGAWYGEPR